jgi:hypothetical protein
LVALPKTLLVMATVGLVASKNMKEIREIQIKYIWLLRTSSKPPQDEIGRGGKLTDEVDGIPGGLGHQASIPGFEHFGWWLPKLAMVTVTKGLVALPKALWDVTVWTLEASCPHTSTYNILVPLYIQLLPGLRSS